MGGTGELMRVLQWTRDNGEVRAFERLRLKMLRLTVREGIRLDRVTLDTKCSPDYLREVRTVATEIVGMPCPY